MERQPTARAEEHRKVSSVLHPPNKEWTCAPRALVTRQREECANFTPPAVFPLLRAAGSHTGSWDTTHGFRFRLAETGSMALTIDTEPRTDRPASASLDPIV